VVNQGEIEGRLDAKYLFDERRKQKLNYAYPISTLEELLSEDPQYGANERAICRDNDNQARYIRITDIDEFGSLRNDSIKTAEKVENKYLLEENDILFARSGATAGKTFIFKKHFGLSLFAGYLIKFKFDETKVLADYVFYYTQLSPYILWIKSIQRPSAQPNINSQEFKSFQIPVPPMDVQTHIVELMQDAHATKQSKEAEATALRQSIDGYVLEQLGITLPTVEKRLCFAVSSSQVQGSRLDGEYNQQHNQNVSLQNQEYEQVPLKHYLDFFTSGSRPKGGVSQFNEGIPSIGGEHILDTGEIESINLKYIPKEFHQKNTKSTLFKRDVLIIKDGATTGKVGILQESYPYEEVNINEHVFLLRVKPQYNPYFLFSFLRTSFGQNQLKKEISGGTITGITKNVFDVVQIPLPPRPLQDAIAEEVQARLARAKQLEGEAKLALASAKANVERLLFGEPSPSP
jgi:restriction endonuclease S subunit